MRQHNTCFGAIFGLSNYHCDKMATPITMKFSDQREMLDFDILQCMLNKKKKRIQLHFPIFLKITRNSVILFILIFSVFIEQCIL